MRGRFLWATEVISMSPFFAERNTVVICSSRADGRYLRQFLDSMSVFPVTLDVWDETRTASNVWQGELQEALGAAKIVFVLASPNLLGMSLTRDKDFPALLEGARRTGKLIYLVMVSPSALEKTVLGQYQAINANFKPVDAMTLFE